MKGLFCKIPSSPYLKRIFGACFCPLFAFLFCIFALNTPTSALSVIGSGTRTVTQSTSYISYTKDGSDSNAYWANQDNASYFFSPIQYNNSIKFSRIHYTLPSSIPANSLLSFSVNFDYYVESGVGIPYFQPTSFSTFHSARTVVGFSCEDHLMDSSVRDVHNLSCSFSVYFNLSTATFDIYFDLSAFNNNPNSILGEVKPSFSRISYVTFDYDALSDNDKDWLSDDFISALQEAQTNAQDEANEHVKDQTTTQTQTSESTANTEGGDSEQAGMTLLQAFSGFVSAITNVSPAQSCDFDLDFSGYHEGLSATVDMCSLSPPAGLTFIGSILLILFCVPLSISTVRRMISLFRSFQT